LIPLPLFFFISGLLQIRWALKGLGGGKPARRWRQWEVVFPTVEEAVGLGHDTSAHSHGNSGRGRGRERRRLLWAHSKVSSEPARLYDIMVGQWR